MSAHTCWIPFTSPQYLALPPFPPPPCSHRMSDKLIPFGEVAKHNNKESCHVIVHGQVYDVTEFLPDHPGEFGANVAVRVGGG